LRRYDDAIRDYSRALDKGTDSSRTSDERRSLALTHQYRGRAYQWYKADHIKAIADFTEALRLDPKMEMVYYRRGQAYSASKQYAKAADDFEAALMRDPGYPNLLCAYAWQLATCPEASFRDGKRSLELARLPRQRFGSYRRFLSCGSPSPRLGSSLSNWPVKPRLSRDLPLRSRLTRRLTAGQKMDVLVVCLQGPSRRKLSAPSGWQSMHWSLTEPSCIGNSFCNCDTPVSIAGVPRKSGCSNRCSRPRRARPSSLTVVFDKAD